MVLEAVPPAGLVLVAAAVAAVVPRDLGHAVGLVATLAVVALAWVVPDGGHLPVVLFGTFDAELYLVDDVSQLMGLIFGFIGAAAVLYAHASDADGRQTAIALAYVGASLGAVYAGDWLTLVFFWELLAVTSTLLVWYHGGAAVRAGFRYAVVHGIGGSLLLGAVIWHYATVEAVAFDAHTGIAAGVPAVLAAVGIGVNVGFIGLHTWLPDTYPRPHVAASVFLCVYTTKTGVYGMFRAFPEGHLWIAYMGGAMAVFGAFVALVQTDMRRLLSYHIQSQVGYMVAGVGLGGAAIGYEGAEYAAELATAGAFGHVFNHILYKALLFMTVGVIIYRTGRENLKRLGGLGVHMPVTAITFTVAALSIAGFPGFNGFVSKGMIIGAADYQQLHALWVLLLLAGVGTFLSFIKLGYFAFLGGTYEGRVADANLGQQVAMVTVAGLCVLFGVWPDLLFGLLPFEEVPVALQEGQYEYTTFTVPHLLEGFGLALVALVVFALARTRLGRVTPVPDVDRVLNPGAHYLARGTTYGLTDAFAAVDGVAAAIATRAYRFGADPAGGLAAALEGAPTGSRLGALSPAVHGGTTHHLRSDIGRTVLLMVALTTVTLVLVL